MSVVLLQNTLVLLHKKGSVLDGVAVTLPLTEPPTERMRLDERRKIIAACS